MSNQICGKLSGAERGAGHTHSGQIRPDQIAAVTRVDAAPVAAAMSVAISARDLAAIDLEHRLGTHITPGMFALGVRTTQRHPTIVQDVDAIEHLAGIGRHRQYRVDIALVVVLTDDEGLHAMLSAEREKAVLLFERGLGTAHHADVDLTCHPVTTLGLERVQEILQGARQIEAHHAAIYGRIERIEADDEPVHAAHLGDLVDLARQHRIAVGDEMQDRVRQATTDMRHALDDTRIDEGLAVEQRLDLGQRKCPAVFDDFLEQGLVHRRFFGFFLRIGTKRTGCITATGGLDGDQSRNFTTVSAATLEHETSIREIRL